MRYLAPLGVAVYAAALAGFALTGTRRVTTLGLGVGGLALVGLLGSVASLLRAGRWPWVAMQVFLAGTFAIGFLFLAARAAFVVRERGMDRADGGGSPFAFLIGLAFEQATLTLPAGLLLATIRRRRHLADSPAKPGAARP